MKGPTGLILVLCLSSTFSLSIWEDGKEYHFLEESAIQVGTNDLDSSVSGLRMMSDVKIQVSGNKLVVSIDNMQEAHYSHSFNRGGWPYALTQEKIKDPKSKYIPSIGYENGNTFSIVLKDGLVSQIELPEGLSVNGKNMMRAMASILQFDMTGHEMKTWNKKEKSIHGECDVLYTFLHGNQKDHKEISKTVSHLRDCVKRNFKLFDNSGAHSCNYKGQKPANDHEHVQQQMHHPEPIHSNSMTTFQVKEMEPNKFNIEKIFSAGAVVVQRFSEAGPTHVTLANRTLTLIDVNDIGEIKPVQNPRTFNDLEFEWMEGKSVWNAPLGIEDLKKKDSFFYNGYTLDEPQAVLIDALKENIKKHVDEMNHFHNPTQYKDESLQKLHKHGIQNLLPYFHSLNYDSLSKLKSYYVGLMTDNETQKSARDVFFEILPVSGTWPAALVVQEMIMNNDLKSDMETTRMLTSIPFHVEPVKALVEEYFKIVKSDLPHLQLPMTKSAVDLSYAHMVKRTCHEHATQQECFKDLHIDEFINRFDALEVDDHAHLQHFMLVFYNFRGSEMLEQKLKQIIFNESPKKYDGALKTQAIFALASRALQKGAEQEYFLPVFLSRGETHEVRTAAFDIMMRGTPTTTTFNKIMTYMIYETDYELFNYVYTAFEKFATHTHEPCFESLHTYAKYFIKYWKQHMWQKPKYTIGVSKTFSNSFNQEKYGYSGSVEVHTVGSHKAATPLSIMVDVRSQRFHHMTMEVFGTFIRMEGVAEEFVEKVKEFIFSGEFEFEKLKQILFTNMNIRQREHVPARLDFIVLMRENVVFEYHLVDSEIKGIMGKLKEYFNTFRTLQDVFKFTKHFGLSWDMFIYEQPTDFGVPMAYASGANSLLGVLGEVRKDTGFLAEVDFRMHLNTDNTDMMMVIHPDQKTRFTIQHDRTFKHQVKSAVTASLDASTRKVMVAVKVPEVETLFSMLGHSQTFMYTSNNKIVGNQVHLKKSCPTCLMKHVVSRGETHRRNADLLKPEIHESGHIYGLELSGKLFDCEVPEASSPGQRFLSLLKSLNPLRTQPKSLFHVFFSGMRQLHTFFFFFPRIESCGANLMISRAAIEPVDEIIIELDLAKFHYLDNHQKILGEKQMTVAGNIIFSGTVNRTHQVDLNFVAAPMWTKSHFDLEIRRKPFMYQSKTYEEFPIIFHMKTMYADIQRPFHLSFTDLTSVKEHKVHSSMELIWGNLDQKIKIEGEHTTTAEAINHLHSTWYYKTCMRDHSLPEWRHSEYIPTTDACLYTAHDLFTLRHYTWDITATNLDQWMVTAYKKAGVVMKTVLFPFWQFMPEYTTHEIAPRQPNIRIEQTVHSEHNTFDLTLKLDKDVSIFMDVSYGLLHWNAEPYQSLSKLSFLTKSLIQPEMMNYMYYNNILNHCHATTESVRTYDNVTYPYTMDHSCYTLISSDCSEHPSFAVFIKKTENGRVGMMTFIGDQKVEFIPMDTRKVKMKINDQEFVLQDNGFLFFPKNKAPVLNKVFQNYLFKIIRREDSYTLTFFPQIMLKYDGNSVQVLAGPHMKGQHCGMCGDYNRNTYHEFIDPQMCSLKTGDEMALAWTLDNKYCSQKISKPACTIQEPVL